VYNKIIAQYEKIISGCVSKKEKLMSEAQIFSFFSISVK